MLLQYWLLLVLLTKFQVRFRSQSLKDSNYQPHRSPELTINKNTCQQVSRVGTTLKYIFLNTRYGTVNGNNIRRS